MIQKAVEVFQALMKRGWIDRDENPTVWSYLQEEETVNALEAFQKVLEFELWKAGARYYMIPTQKNTLFLKNNVDYRRDIKGDRNVRLIDLYMLNYLSMYLLFLFFNGEGSNPQTRTFITKEEFVRLFTEHCRAVERAGRSGENKEEDNSESFLELAQRWLGKKDGVITSRSFEDKYGMLNRMMSKYKNDELFDEDGEHKIYPTQKLKDLMPYFLRKSRIAEIQAWFKGEDGNAQNE